MSKTVVGLFDHFADAQMVVQNLVDGGFRREDISLAANQTATGYTGDGSDLNNGQLTTGEAAGQDAGVGAGVGGVVGLLVGLGALAIPGIGPILAAGPLAAALGITVGSTLTGAAIGAAAGGILGALTHLGVPQDQAEYYAEGVRRGGTLVTVSASDSDAQKAVDIMNGAGAVDIDSRGANYRTSGYAGYSQTAPAYTHDEIVQERGAYQPPSRPTASPDTATNTGTMNTGGETVIPIVEEELSVGKRQVQGGGARIHTRITERPVEEQVTLREENVTVNRRTVDRAVTDADMAFKEQNFEVTETSEVPVVSKTARVVEEVVVGKTASEHTETVRDTVRRTDVDVEDMDTASTDRTTDTGRTAGMNTTGTNNAGSSAMGNGVPGIQTGGRDADGSPDTRGIMEKAADSVTGDRTDDKTGKPTG